jgi:hypothetical protein
MKTNQKIISAEFYIEGGEYNKPVLILEVLENGNIKRNTYEFQKYLSFYKSPLYHYTEIIYFNNNLSICSIELSSHVSLYYNYDDDTTRTLLAFLNKTDDNRFLYGKAFEEYKEKVKIEEKKKETHIASKSIMQRLNIKTYKQNYTLNVNKIK